MFSARSDSSKSGLLCACPFASHNTLVSVAITHPKYPRGPLAPPSVAIHKADPIFKCVVRFA
eukprot:3708074-Ditylum_brightwellii.AAC.1